MEWILDHLNMLVPVLLVLSFLFQGLFNKNRTEEQSRSPADSEAEEEARRIREEIRRKIVARQRGEALPEEPVAEKPSFERPRPVFQERPVTVFPRQEARPPAVPSIPKADPALVAASQVEPVQSQPDLLEQLRKEQERLKKARQEREKAHRQTRGRGRRREQVSAKKSGGRRGNLRQLLLEDLSTPRNMRRAIVLKEVIERKF